MLERVLILRRVVGSSMEPRLKPGRLVWSTPLLRNRLHPGNAVILVHEGRENIKRIERINWDTKELFVIGDNLKSSRDSRHYGWLPIAKVKSKVIWPRLHN